VTGLTITGKPDGPPIVFLHGAVINRVMWSPVTRLLHDRYLCIALDLPGHGDRVEESFDIPTAVAITLDAISAYAGGSATVVGMSLGGYVAQAVASASAGSVTGLVLSGATIRYTGWPGVSSALYGYIFPLLGRAAIKAFPRELAKTVGEELAQEIVATGLSARAGGQALRRLPGTDYAAGLATFSGPVVIANGERDKANIKHVPLFLEHVPSAHVITIDDAGHACALQKPRPFAGAVELASGSFRRLQEEA
jgi:pimeloyl-ACP methyl ester carboxylesterase